MFCLLPLLPRPLLAWFCILSCKHCKHTGKHYSHSTNWVVTDASCSCSWPTRSSVGSSEHILSSGLNMPNTLTSCWMFCSSVISVDTQAQWRSVRLFQAPFTFIKNWAIWALVWGRSRRRRSCWPCNWHRLKSWEMTNCAKHSHFIQMQISSEAFWSLGFLAPRLSQSREPPTRRPHVCMCVRAHGATYACRLHNCHMIITTPQWRGRQSRLAYVAVK